MSEKIKLKILELLKQESKPLSTLAISKNVQPKLHFYQTKCLLLELLFIDNKVTLVDTSSNCKYWSLKNE